MSVREYIGARYVPMVASPVLWDINTVYEPLTIVLDASGNSYISRERIPSGTPLTDSKWLKTYDYNAQMATLSADIATKVSKAGDRMSGVLDMTTHKITGLADGTEDPDAINVSQLNSVNTNLTSTINTTKSELEQQIIDAQTDTVKTTGSTMTGQLNTIAPVANTNAANKLYVDNLIQPILNHFNHDQTIVFSRTSASADAWPGECDGGFLLYVTKDKRRFSFEGYMRNTTGNVPAGRVMPNGYYGYKITPDRTIDNGGTAQYVSSVGTLYNTYTGFTSNYILMKSLYIDVNGALWMEGGESSAGIENALLVFTITPFDLGFAITPTQPENASTPVLYSTNSQTPYNADENEHIISEMRNGR